jgi:uncharacterized protein (TIGR01777 family)
VTPTHVAVTGASGLLGSALVPALTSAGHRVTRLVRRHPRADEIRWDPAAGMIDAGPLEGIQAVVHLAGENIGARWTAARKRRIRESRVGGTQLLSRTLAGLRQPSRVLISASAVGIYGSRGDELLTESSALPSPPGDFLAQLGREWEEATQPAASAGVRVVPLRFGIVLAPSGGVLARMLPPFRLGLGGPFGDGRQWMSWVSIEDVVGAILHALSTEELAGPVNATAPQPVTNRVFATTLGRVLHRPAILPLPSIAIKIALGEMGSVALLGSQRVVPPRLLRSGYRFRHPELEGALRAVLRA